MMFIQISFDVYVTSYTHFWKPQSSWPPQCIFAFKRMSRWPLRYVVISDHINSALCQNQLQMKCILGPASTSPILMGGGKD